MFGSIKRWFTERIIIKAVDRLTEWLIKNGHGATRPLLDRAAKRIGSNTAISQFEGADNIKDVLQFIQDDVDYFKSRVMYYYSRRK